MPETWRLDSAELTLELQWSVHQTYLRIVVTCSVIAREAIFKHTHIHIGGQTHLGCMGHGCFNKELTCSTMQCMCRSESSLMPHQRILTHRRIASHLGPVHSISTVQQAQWLSRGLTAALTHTFHHRSREVKQLALRCRPHTAAEHCTIHTLTSRTQQFMMCISLVCLLLVT